MAARAGGTTPERRTDSGQLARMPAALEGLGARDAQLAGLVATGLSDAEIASRLALGAGEVQVALEALLRMLHLRSRTELALLANGRPMGPDR